MIDLDDTIVAVSSASGAGARAVVRLSGPQALDLAAAVFSSPVERRRQRLEGNVHIPEMRHPFPADLYLWLGPHSFTGQDMVELHVLSSPPLVELLVSRLLSLGARAAQPGELTMRGYLSGKLDLTRAEAVLGVIEASSRTELKHALTQLAGGVTRPLLELREDLLNLQADVEAGLDFSAEDLEFVAVETLIKRLAKALALVTLAGKQVDQKSVGDRPFRAVLAGRPNAGKSSLFNALTGGRALVSPEAGTTRDYLLCRVEMHGVEVELADTAGWQPVAADIGQQAQQLGRAQADEADLILLCVPGAEELLDQETDIVERRLPPVLTLATKCDELEAFATRLATSATSGLGLEELRGELSRQARSWARPALAPSLGRCRHHITACLDHLRKAHSAALFGDPPEVLAMELRGALDQLGEMTGAVYTEELLDRVFSRFCIGK